MATTDPSHTKRIVQVGEDENKFMPQVFRYGKWHDAQHFAYPTALEAFKHLMEYEGNFAPKVKDTMTRKLIRELKNERRGLKYAMSEIDAVIKKLEK